MKMMYRFVIAAALLVAAGVFGCDTPSDGGGADRQNDAAPGKAATPVATPPGVGWALTVGPGTPVSLVTATTGATVYYSLDGSVPSTPYAGAVTISGEDGAAVVLRAVAKKAGWTDSDVLAVTYMIDAGMPATPTATPAPGTAVVPGGEITLTAAGADIYYTTDGEMPDETKTRYNAETKIVVSEGIAPGGVVTIKAVAVKEGGVSSAVLEAVYTIAAAGQQSPGGAAQGNLTANVTYSPTANEDRVQYQYVSGRGTAAETWNMTVTETPVLYFAVRKKAAQTITVGGADAALVRPAAPGETVDEVTAGDTLAVFTVNANKLHNGKFMGGAARSSDGKTTPDVYDEWYDSLFEGDDFQFTLNVTDPEKNGKTVTVNLRQNVKQEAAVFIVKYDGEGNFAGLERQTGIMRYEGITNRGAYSESTKHTVNISTTTPGTRLLDMLVWIDQQLNNKANSSVEYLVRVVADEEMVCVGITYNASASLSSSATEPSGKIRLRGSGTSARVIRPTENAQAEIYYKNYGTSDSRSGNPNGTAYPFIYLAHSGTLQLEKNITLEGGGFSSYMIWLHQAHLIMKDSAIIADQHSRSGLSATIYLEFSASSIPEERWPRFTMEGGSITDNSSISVNYAPIKIIGNRYVHKGSFSITGGTITDNFNGKGEVRNGILWDSSFEALW
jgi:hypothetical protein